MDNIYTNYQRKIELKSLSDKVNIWFFGDVHRDAEACDADRWKWFLERSQKDDPENTYYFGMGDFNDYASYTERKHIKNGELHETTIAKFDRMAKEDVEFIADEMKHMKGKMLGLIEGNHTWEFTSGQTATELLCERMESPYLGWLTHYTISFSFPGGKGLNVYIVACHGKAGGKRVGASINQLEDMKTIFPAADIYAMGHNHDRGAWPVDVLLPVTGKSGVKIKQKRQFLCRSGSFLKAYEKGKGGYVTNRLLRPADLGALKLTIGFHRDYTDGDRIITDIEAII